MLAIGAILIFHNTRFHDTCICAKSNERALNLLKQYVFLKIMFT